MNKNIAQSVVDKIKKERIQPVPKWKVISESVLCWGVFGMLFLVSALFFSLFVFHFVDVGPAVGHSLRPLQFFALSLATAPYLWIFLFGLILTLSYFIFRKTQHGYRYSILLWVTVATIGIIAISLVSHIMQINDRAERFLQERSIDKPLLISQEDRWMHPEQGLLIGGVIEIRGEVFILMSPERERWTVMQISQTEVQGDPLRRGSVVRVIGEKTGEFEFSAKIIKIRNLKNIPPNMRGERNERRLDGDRDREIDDFENK